MFPVNWNRDPSNPEARGLYQYILSYCYIITSLLFTYVVRHLIYVSCQHANRQTKFHDRKYRVVMAKCQNRDSLKWFRKNCDVGKIIASRQNDVGKFYAGETGVGKMGGYDINVIMAE
ncbi:hypothetical protein RhiirA5_382732 [Rhizophagus irregularis]|uniref:Uncharacterized protein n=1 Tax=Rhizophagus irregularis TaxID=588596 RepID=A0A2N0NZN0_9GLOM|nr:hypothetical protein RhiirA5_382732 [Rhizophagus irregularis]